MHNQALGTRFNILLVSFFFFEYNNKRKKIRKEKENNAITITLQKGLLYLK